MRAICLHQPYASLVVHGFKANETRASDTRFRGRFAIVATKPRGKAHGQECLDVVIDAHVAMGGSPSDFALMWSVPWGETADLPLGIVGTVNLVGTSRAEDALVRCNKRELAAGHYGQGRWAWHLEEPVPLHPPIKVRGRQFWFTVPDLTPVTLVHADALPKDVALTPGVG